ncbi:ExeA family protein [Stagnihabitans tardus]|uniref:AAA family ATPase n=1 Tax=Stagnihabitans tardus TaxID=2699202 RepID=A0AAE4YBJ5_9RHOB|nr:AAA family ATPase [Stagnihabitans tardus]NBZ89667.1 AAA family ATPase [Stagnihabitans tardus]
MVDRPQERPGQGGAAGLQSRTRGPERDAGLAPPDVPNTGAHLRQSFYAEHFGFHDHPFTLMPDPSMILWSRAYRRAFSVLEYGVISGSPITLLTGGIGCGKTTLLRELLTRLDETVTVALVSNAQGGRGELLQWVLNALGLGFDPAAGYVALFQTLRDFLVAEYAAGRRTLLIFDEAQNLSIESLEELRMLTNVNYGKDVVVQLVLTGQPELRDLVRSPRLEQLAQRIAVSYDLTPLDAPTTADFIRHRLTAAGGTGAEFDEGALAMIHRVSKGVPRLINQFCDISLLYAWTADQRQVGETLLAQVLEDNIFFAAQGLKEAAKELGASPDASDTSPSERNPA